MKDIELEKAFFYQIDKLMKAVNDYTLAVFKENKFPVTKDQWVILKKVSESMGSTQKQIADSTFKDPAALTRILDLLVQMGFVQRKSSMEDRRAFEIILTVDGSRLVNRMTPIVQEIRTKALAGISEEEEQVARNVLEKMRHNFN